MTREPKRRAPTPGEADPEALYAELVRLMYDEGDRDGARQVAARLDDVLIARADFAVSIRGDEVRSLLAELRGDLAEAIRTREAEIEKIRALHRATRGTPGWEYVARRYDDADVSDRLDLLAILYDESGDTARAVATLAESRRYCEAHRVAFDGQDLLDEFGPARGADRRKKAASKRPAD